MRFVLVLALAACAAGGGVGARTLDPALRGVGVRTLDPALAVFYPSPSASRTSHVGPYELAATPDAPVAPGEHPLVVISHGHGGSMWGHHDLAEALARAGYVVATLEHAGDNWHDQSAVATGRMLIDRPHQVSAAIDRVLADRALHVDPARIGVAGFSAGGYTALMVIGARPDFTRFRGYCERHPDDEMCALRDVPFPALDRAKDPRVTAAFAMAPLGLFFGPGAFDDVTAPIFLAWATADRVLLPAENAELVKRAPTLQGTRVVEGAGHYVFLAPCSFTEELCSDPAGVDRAAVHAQLARDAAAFFSRGLVAGRGSAPADRDRSRPAAPPEPAGATDSRP
jgi:predicted dienelactone hydrolase